MQPTENNENNFSILESRFSPAQMRALRRRAKRIHAGARSSTEILNALAARVECNPAAVLRDATPAELHGPTPREKCAKIARQPQAENRVKIMGARISLVRFFE